MDKYINKEHEGDNDTNFCGILSNNPKESGWNVTIPPRPLRYINFFELFHFTAGDQLVVPIGASHISLPLQEIQSREWEKKEQTNNMLGLIQAQEGSYATLHFLWACVD